MLTYRPDVDGLRALSIIVVLLFHAGFDDWSGGFVGVDVFFVISGYLITSLIATEMAEGRFSLARFYERRVRRLLPSTIPVLLFTTAFAWAFYTTDRFLEFAQSLIAVATYSSNWFFLHVGGYFAGGAETTPLLHTWSLAVEEQFYLVFPFLMILIARRPARVRPVLAGIAIASLAYSQHLIGTGKTDLSFFSSLSRFWELMLGALLALSPALIRRLAPYSTAMRLAGLVLILVPVFTYSENTPFPGFAGLPPTIGAVLLIAASPQRGDAVLSLLQSAPAVYIGRISYALYLWHWPILGAMSTLVFDHNDLHKVLAILLSVALAALSYHWLEQPIRRRTWLARRRDVAGLLAAATAASIAIGVYGWQSGGWPGRMSPEAERMAAVAAQRAPDPDQCFNLGDKPSRFCRLNGAAGQPLDLVLWGDSHAQSIAPALRKYAGERGLAVGFALKADCPPVVGAWRAKDPTQSCRRFNDEALAFLAEARPRLVVMAAWWSNYTSGRQLFLDDARAATDRGESLAIFEAALGRTLEGIAARGAVPVVLEQVPQNSGSLPSASLVLGRLGLPLDTVASATAEHRKRQRPMATLLDRWAQTIPLARIDPAQALCRTEVCAVEAGGKLLYLDNDHLNLDGSLFLYPYLAAELDKLFARRPP